MAATGASSLLRFLTSCHLLVITLGSTVNPFLNQNFYINPVNAKEFESSITTASGTVRSNLQKMQGVPSAYWIDRKIKIRGSGTTTVEGILKDASSKSPPELVVLMFYDLPNRDCDAKASNGEICCSKNPDGTCDYLAPGDCAEGIEEYKSGYVDPFASVLSEYDGKVPVVLILEPDGLANLATNIADPHCGNVATQTAYKHGVKYAVEQISTKAPSVAMYLDAAHGGWLGWENNLEEFMKMLKELSLPFDKIRGFATNVANYQALGIQCPWCPDQGFRNGYCMNGKHGSDPCCKDPCSLLSQWNFGNNELNYAAGLVAAADSVLGMEAHVIIDTGRNGVADQRQDCANWCNPRGAGAGVPSTTKTANTSLVDAYFWLKTPGESDGCSETLPDGKKCPRFDSKCASVDSLGVEQSEEPAPEAGLWYDFQVKQLAENAHFDPPKSKADGKCPASANAAQPSLPAVVSVPSTMGTTGGTRSRTSSGACAGAYQQCGGTGFLGAKCCQDGCKCTSSGGYYSQCTPLDPSAGGKCSAGGLAGAGAAASASTGSAGLGTSSVSPASAGSTRSGTSKLPATMPAMPLMPASSRSGGGLRPMIPQTLPASPLVPATAPQTVQSPLLTTKQPQTVQLPLLTTKKPHASTTASTTVPAPATSAMPVAVPAPLPAPLPSAQPVQAQASSQCAVPYGQCGGSGWNGPNCCDAYCTCQVVDTHRSQCVPKGSGMFGGHSSALAAPLMPSQGSSVAIVLKDELPGGQDDLGGHAASSFAPWAALPVGLAFVALAAGLARRRIWAAYAAVDGHQSQDGQTEMLTASPDADIA